jgi:response regulator RpfG family c-di-GMP phosphodiesterase
MIRHRIQLVDDEPMVLELLSQAVASWQYSPRCAGSAEEALEQLLADPVPILLTDLEMGERDGTWLVKQVRDRWPDTVIMVLTGRCDADAAIGALHAGAERYFLKPPNLLELQHGLQYAVETVELRKQRRDYQAELERTVRRQTRKIRHTFLSAIESLNLALEARDAYTNGHSFRVRRYSVALGRKLGLPRSQLRRVALAARLHDIGKVGVPEAILTKSGPLTREEIAEMQKHPVIGEQILRPIIRDRGVLAGIRLHHERIDGRGYPDGLRGEAIPLVARLISVADCFDALTSARPYRNALSLPEAVAVLRDAAGTQLDAAFVGAFLQIVLAPNAPSDAAPLFQPSEIAH